ncbi:MAG: hypothetical protein JWO44_2675 [Bacteroidetes bacterium]|jgi:hypothetical protein|nr:hypothetical protein [Bacteroidota bacterium]
MRFFKKRQDRTGPEQSEAEQEAYVEAEKGTYLINKAQIADFTFTDLSEKEYLHIEASREMLQDMMAPLLKFSMQPVNHPANLDEYLNLWGNSGYGDFLGFSAAQHTAFLSYNFGQYLVENYGMQWKTKSDGEGTQTVVRVTSPVEMELYPVDSTLRAIRNKELAIYCHIETKLKNAIRQFGN